MQDPPVCCIPRKILLVVFTTAGDGGDANLPSVLQDNPSIAAHWRSFLMAALFDPQPTNHSSSSSTSSSSTAPGLARAAAAACCLLLQDRVDDAEDVLAGLDLEAAAARLLEGDPLRMQVSASASHYITLH
jgi:hypothetical protein